MPPASLPPSSKVPPRFLPTLTEVVVPGQKSVALPPLEAEPLPVVSSVSDPEPESEIYLNPAHFQVEELIERVMDRLHNTIEVQIREVMSEIINDQIRLLEPRMVQEVLHVVRQSVIEAVTQDINSQPKSAEFDL